MENEFRFNFKKEFKLWKACAKDDFRPVMEHVLFKDGYAYASDGHILVRVPLNECTTFDEEDILLLDGYLLHSSLLKYVVGFDAVKVQKADDGALYLEAKAGENTVLIELAKDGESLKYPKTEEILKGKSERTPIQKIGFNPKLLASLKDVLNTDRLKFEFTDEASAVFVRPLSDLSNAVGIIMPIMI